ncbi:YdeI/OmpD-associated family protein [Owenweeksia hongkongensis]|uniref:YdeI/OmpD-associated family protein n=1 Tax=Owenweeksia hongkongensis TaxID=253245 RepID=UPI003A91483E
MKDPQNFTPASQQEWHNWLKANYESEEAVWLIIYKKGSGIPSLTWSEAVDEALCFGWIDSVKKTIDKEKYKQYFCKRKPKSIWSKINKEKVEQLIAEKRMTPAGMRCIEIAKQNGSWTFLDSVDALIIPKDLEAELDNNPRAKDYFEGLSNSAKKLLLYWVISAKREETRSKRIIEIAENAALGTKPKAFR